MKSNLALYLFTCFTNGCVCQWSYENAQWYCQLDNSLHAMLSTSVHPVRPQFSLRARHWPWALLERNQRLAECEGLNDAIETETTCRTAGINTNNNAEAGCHFLLQRIFLTQGSNLHLLHLLHCRQILYCWATGEAPVKNYRSLFMVLFITKVSGFNKTHNHSFYHPSPFFFVFLHNSDLCGVWMTCAVMTLISPHN